MATNSCFKYALCMEWTTELPFDNKPCESPRINLEGIEWYLKFTCDYSYKLDLTKVNSDSTMTKNIVATTAIKNASALDEEPVLFAHTNIRYCSSYINIWSKRKDEISNQIPNVLAVGKCTVVCLFHNSETHFEKTHLSRQIDFASASRSTLCVDLQSLSLDFSTFWKDETFTDVDPTCGDRTFSCHKSVLAARSEVFASMFRTRMEEIEVDDNDVDGDSKLEFDIKDVDPEVFELLLEYMYSGKKPDLVESTARPLYEAADKFAVHALKGTCSVWMVGNLTLLNCLGLLVLADKHSDKQFLEAVKDFTSKHLRKIKKESWITFKNDYPKLAIEVYDKHFGIVISDEE